MSSTNVKQLDSQAQATYNECRMTNGEAQHSTFDTRYSTFDRGETIRCNAEHSPAEVLLSRC